MQGVSSICDGVLLLDPASSQLYAWLPSTSSRPVSYMCKTATVLKMLILLLLR
jgi:hypothetical protein